MLSFAASSPPAGGGATSQVVFGTLGAALVTAAMLGIVAGHRTGRLKAVGRLAGFSERVSGLPGWAALPLSVIACSLIVAVLGMYWDISIHIDKGRDPGPFANTAHYLILAGLFGITFAGLLAMAIPRDGERPSATAVRLTKDWYAPLGGVLIFVCAGFALSGFPLDDAWHRIFGQDVTLWGPTHLLLFGGAALSTVGAWLLMAEGRREAKALGLKGNRYFMALQEVSIAGGFLIALSTFQGEFDYSVPQFRLDMHPILLMLAASIALVAARLRVGRGGALGAVAFFLVIRGLLSLYVGPLAGHTTLHFPLYLAEAAVVELVAVRIARDRPLVLGAVAGAAIGVFGLAAEWGWSYAWWTLNWPSSMLPEAAIAAFVAAVAGGVIGGFVGRALISPQLQPRSRPRFVVAGALVVALGVVIWATPISHGQRASADVTLREVSPSPKRQVGATVRLHPAGAADGARWLTATAWQGGGSVVDKLERVREGVYRSTQPIPVYGNWKSTIRLARGTAVQGLPVFLPKDPAIPVGGVSARPTFTHSFTVDKKLLQREQKGDVPGALTAIAYLTTLLIGLGLVASLGTGLRRLDRAGSATVESGTVKTGEQRLRRMGVLGVAGRPGRPQVRARPRRDGEAPGRAVPSAVQRGHARRDAGRKRRAVPYRAPCDGRPNGSGTQPSLADLRHLGAVRIDIRHLGALGLLLLGQLATSGLLVGILARALPGHAVSGPTGSGCGASGTPGSGWIGGAGSGTSGWPGGSGWTGSAGTSGTCGGSGGMGPSGAGTVGVSSVGAMAMCGTPCSGPPLPPLPAVTASETGLRVRA